MSRRSDTFFASENANSVEEEIRSFQDALEIEFEHKVQECRLAKEEALLRLSEMEKETIRKVEEEWGDKQAKIDSLGKELEREIEFFSVAIAEKADYCEAKGDLLTDFWKLLVGEIDL